MFLCCHVLFERTLAEDDGESVATAIAVNRGASVATASISPFFGIPTISHVHFAIHLAHLFLLFRILLNTNTRCQTRTAMKKQKSTFVTLGIEGEPCLSVSGKKLARKVSIHCLCVILVCVWHDSNLCYYSTRSILYLLYFRFLTPGIK